MTRYILVNKPARPTVGARGVRCRRARALLERYCTVSFETIVATFHLPLSLEYPPAQHSCRGQCCGRWRMTSCSCPQKLGRICRLCAKTRPSSASFNQKLSCQHATMRLFYGAAAAGPPTLQDVATTAAAPAATLGEVALRDFIAKIQTCLLAIAGLAVLLISLRSLQPFNSTA